MMRFFTLFLLFLFSQLLPAQTADWSLPEILFANAAQPSSVDLDGDVSGQYFDAKPDVNHHLHLVWSDQATGETEIFYSKKGGAAFSTPVNISQLPQTSSAWPSLAVGLDGLVYCAWTELNEDLEGAAIFMAFRNLSGIWSAPILVSDPDTDPISIYPSVCIASSGEVFLAYTTVAFDDVEIDYLFEIRFVSFDHTNLTINDLPPPETDLSVSAYRPIIVANRTGGVHCMWYDGDNGGVPSNRFVAHSLFNGTTWGATTTISDASEQVWDDLPLQCLTNDAGDLTVLWASFMPLENQMAVKPIGQNFLPSQVIPFETSNWDAAITEEGNLHVVGDSPQGSLDYAMRSGNSWIMGAPLVNQNDAAGNFPELVVCNDTLHLFWEENGQLFHRTKSALTSKTAETQKPIFSISPNPCSEWLQIISGLPIEGYPVQVFDATGRLVLQQQTSDQNQIHVESLLPGIYMLSIVSEGKQFTQTFIKT